MNIHTIPFPVKAALGYHVLAIIYGIIKIPSAIQTGAFGVGQLVGLALFALAFILILVRRNFGRWLTVALFSFGLIFCLLTLTVFTLKDGLTASSWPLLLFVAFFSWCGGALAFGSSTKSWAHAADT